MPTPKREFDSFSVGKIKPILISAAPDNQKRIINTGAGKLFYKTAENVGTGDTEVAAGAAVTIKASVWVISETNTKVLVETAPIPTITAISTETIDATYGAPEEAVLKNLKLRSEQMEAALRQAGIVV